MFVKCCIHNYENFKQNLGFVENKKPKITSAFYLFDDILKINNINLF